MADMKSLVAILFYYGFISLVFLGINSDSTITGLDATSNVNLTTISDDVKATNPTDIISLLIAIVKFFTFLLFGIGLPSDTPFLLIGAFAVFETCVTIAVAIYLYVTLVHG